jgi:hypothetical protein
MRLEESRRLEGSGRQLESFVVWVGLRLEGSDRQMELSIRRLDGPLPQNQICWGFARFLVSPLCPELVLWKSEKAADMSTSLISVAQY